MDFEFLLLEDSGDLARRLERIAKRRGWKWKTARTLEQAKRIVHERVPKVPFNAAILDLMLPENEARLAVVDEKLGERAKAGSELVRLRATDAAGSSKRQQELLDLMVRIDSEIQANIEPDAGIMFLISDEVNRSGVLKGVPTAICTARRVDEACGSDCVELLRAVLNGRTLEHPELYSAVKAALRENEPARWFEKPVSSMDLEGWLAELANAAR